MRATPRGGTRSAKIISQHEQPKNYVARGATNLDFDGRHAEEFEGFEEKTLEWIVSVEKACGIEDAGRGRHGKGECCDRERIMAVVSDVEWKADRFYEEDDKGEEIESDVVGEVGRDVVVDVILWD